MDYKRGIPPVRKINKKARCGIGISFIFAAGFGICDIFPAGCGIQTPARGAPQDTHGNLSQGGRVGYVFLSFFSTVLKNLTLEFRNKTK